MGRRLRPRGLFLILIVAIWGCAPDSTEISEAGPGACDEGNAGLSLPASRRRSRETPPIARWGSPSAPMERFTSETT